MENSAVFGLRRSGKTSILFSVLRTIVARNQFASVIDCQLLHLNRWWVALYYIANRINSEHKSHVAIDQNAYSEQAAAMQFEHDITKIRNKLGKNILIILDEIEQITFDISISEHWKKGGDYIKFWHVLRGIFQKDDSPFTYIIAGTNPKCLETPFVNGSDNPLYAQIKPEYIENFTVEQTKQMVKTLSTYMGISFEEGIFTDLKRDYGGHPFLIRQVCSYISKQLKLTGNLNVDRDLYKRAITEFNQDSGHIYFDMVIGVLQEHYPDEYTMLCMLAAEDISDFNSLAESDVTYISHLLGYGVIEKSTSGYSFKIDSLKIHLQRRNIYKRLNLTNEEKLSEMSARRNKVEVQLRKIVMQQLRSLFGEAEAKEKILAKHDAPKRRKYFHLAYKELFDPSKHEIYFDDLRDLMRRNWEKGFRNIFEEDVEKFNSRMVILNDVGRGDAHAKIIENHDMESFRGAISWLEEKVDNHLN